MKQPAAGKKTCVDCGACACNGKGSSFPDFCLTAGLDPAAFGSVMEEYEKPENRSVMTAAALVEHEGYGRWCRVRETIEFARKMGFHRLGIATCMGLISESRTLARILRSHGFEVYGIGCKVGAVPKVEVGIPEECEDTGVNMCNPLLQAELLNRAETELNIVMGLCVGHDSLFYRHSEAPVTTLVAKDRVTGHNPAAALYTSGSYYRHLFEE